MAFFNADHFADPFTVGFTGSGKTMRKDPTRSRHVYQPNEELD
jgi:hypothetical protein